MGKHFLFKVITAWFLLTQTLPPFNLIMPFTGVIQLAVFVGASLMLFPNLLGKRSILAMLAYGLTMLIFFVAGNGFFSTINVVIVPFLCMMSGLIIGEYTLKYDKEYDYTKLVLIVVLTCDFLMALITIPQLWIRPDIIYGMTINSETSSIDRAVYSFVISYQTIHGLALLMAPLFFLCKKEFALNKKYFVLFSVLSLVLLYVVYRSNGTTALLIGLLMAVIGFVVNMEKLNRNNIYRLILIGLFGFTLIQPAVITPILRTIQNTMDSSSGNYTKLGEIQDKILYDESGGDLGIRDELYNNSTNLFLESPLWGTSSPQLIGQHSFILDRLALFGILFIVPLVLVFYNNYRAFYHNLIHTKIIYLFSILAMLFMLYMKNDFEQGTWLYGFAYLPILCRYIDYEMEYHYKTSKK